MGASSASGAVARLALLVAIAAAVWGWWEGREVSRLEQSLGAANQRIDQLTASLQTAQQQIRDAQQQLLVPLAATPEQAGQAPEPAVGSSPNKR